MKRKFVSGFLIVVLVLSTVPAFALPVIQIRPDPHQGKP